MTLGSFSRFSQHLSQAKDPLKSMGHLHQLWLVEFRANKNSFLARALYFSTSLCSIVCHNLYLNNPSYLPLNGFSPCTLDPSKLVCLIMWNRYLFGSHTDYELFPQDFFHIMKLSLCVNLHGVFKGPESYDSEMEKVAADKHKTDETDPFWDDRWTLTADWKLIR